MLNKFRAELEKSEKELAEQEDSGAESEVTDKLRGVIKSQKETVANLEAAATEAVEAEEKAPTVEEAARKAPAKPAAKKATTRKAPAKPAAKKRTSREIFEEMFGPETEQARAAADARNKQIMLEMQAEVEGVSVEELTKREESKERQRKDTLSRQAKRELDGLKGKTDKASKAKRGELKEFMANLGTMSVDEAQAKRTEGKLKAREQRASEFNDERIEELGERGIISHFTRSQIKTFREGLGRMQYYGEGIYFTNDKEYASRFTDTDRGVSFVDINEMTLLTRQDATSTLVDPNDYDAIVRIVGGLVRRTGYRISPDEIRDELFRGRGGRTETTLFELHRRLMRIGEDIELNRKRTNIEANAGQLVRPVFNAVLPKYQGIMSAGLRDVVIWDYDAINENIVSDVSPEMGAEVKAPKAREQRVSVDTEGPTIVYRSGAVDSKAEPRGMMSGGRSTGHFGTGAYFFSDRKRAEEYDDRDVTAVDTRDYNLAPASLYLHKTLRKINGRVKYQQPHTFTAEEVEAVMDAIRFPGIQTPEIRAQRKAQMPEAKRAAKEATRLYNEPGNIDSASTSVMKALGYEGVYATPGSDMDNSTYGTVIYEVKPKAREQRASEVLGRYKFRPDGSLIGDAKLASELRGYMKKFGFGVEQFGERDDRFYIVEDGKRVKPADVIASDEVAIADREEIEAEERAVKSEAEDLRTEGLKKYQDEYLDFPEGMMAPSRLSAREQRSNLGDSTEGFSTSAVVKFAKERGFSDKAILAVRPGAEQAIAQYDEKAARVNREIQGIIQRTRERVRGEASIQAITKQGCPCQGRQRPYRRGRARVPAWLQVLQGRVRCRARSHGAKRQAADGSSYQVVTQAGHHN